VRDVNIQDEFNLHNIGAFDTEGPLRLVDMPRHVVNA
jgi:hypothetical protein